MTAALRSAPCAPKAEAGSTSSAASTTASRVWPDERFWEELNLLLDREAATTIVTGPSIEKSIAPLRSFVAEPMRFGRLFLAGEGRPHRAADRRQEPQSGRQRRLLSLAGLADFYDAKSTAGLDAYSDRALARVWQAERFSWWMTSMLHKFPDQGEFGARIQLAELDYLVGSKAAATSLSENYVGLPY